MLHEFGDIYIALHIAQKFLKSRFSTLGLDISSSSKAMAACAFRGKYTGSLEKPSTFLDTPSLDEVVHFRMLIATHET